VNRDAENRRPAAGPYRDPVLVFHISMLHKRIANGSFRRRADARTLGLPMQAKT
jgi:hypothetical protein